MPTHATSSTLGCGTLHRKIRQERLLSPKLISNKKQRHQWQCSLISMGVREEGVECDSARLRLTCSSKNAADGTNPLVGIGRVIGGRKRRTSHRYTRTARMISSYPVRVRNRYKTALRRMWSNRPRRCKFSSAKIDEISGILPTLHVTHRRRHRARPRSHYFWTGRPSI